LPRSGPWLAHFKQLLAFPMYGTVIWLAWVLGAQRDNDAVVRLLFALLALGFVLWTWRIVRGGGARRWLVAGIAVLAAGAIVAAPLFVPEAETPARASARESTGWDAWSPAKVESLQSAGRTVFVDFTAAWCVTCQVNKRLVLETSEMRAAFARGNVALLRADWTKRDATITEALARLGRNGVPAYVVYQPGKAPQLLPEILDRAVVVDAIGSG
jgi:thiol:disulfide interchange protein DsbD